MILELSEPCEPDCKAYWKSWAGPMGWTDGMDPWAGPMGWTDGLGLKVKT